MAEKASSLPVAEKASSLPVAEKASSLTVACLWEITACAAHVEETGQEARKSSLIISHVRQQRKA